MTVHSIAFPRIVDSPGTGPYHLEIRKGRDRVVIRRGESLRVNIGATELLYDVAGDASLGELAYLATSLRTFGLDVLVVGD